MMNGFSMHQVKIIFYFLIIFIISLIIFTNTYSYKFGFCYGESMKPTLQNFTVIWGNAPSSLKDVSVGDIVTFYWQPMSEVVTHRVVDISDDGIIFTMGDNRQTGEVIALKDVRYVVTGYWIVF